MEKNIRPRTEARIATFLLASSMFATGACGLVTEYVLSTVSTYILGNSIEQFSITIALMLLMMGVAGWTQRFVGDVKLIEKFVFLEVLIAVLGAFAPIAIYAASGFMEDHFGLIQYFFICSIGYLIGFELPLVLRINERFSKTLGVNIANIYGPDYIGAFVGAVVWVSILLKRFPLTQISFIVAGVNFSIAVVTFLYFRRRKLVASRILAPVAMAATALVLLYGCANNRSWNLALEQKLYDDNIVFSSTTRYQRLVLTRSRRLNEYRLYINGNLQFSSLDEAIYHENLVHPAMSLVPDHRRVLILGGGDGLALREILKYGDVDDVALVDIDPVMTELFSTNPLLTRLNGDAFKDSRVLKLPAGGVSDGPKRGIYMETGKNITGTTRTMVNKIGDVSVVNLDADRFIDRINDIWNVIVIDFPDPNSVELVKLYSREFYMKVRKVLAENGMFVVQATSPYHAREAFLCIQRTIEAAGFSTMPYHENVPSFGDWGWILAWKHSVPRKRILRKIDNLSFNVPTSYLTPEVFRRGLVFGKGWLESDSDRINTLMEPNLLTYYVKYGWTVE